jgi:tetratricopeptide (TPR) repeat protein
MNNNISNQEFKQALAIISRNPKNIEAQILAGVYYSQKKMLDKSVTHFKKALTGDKNNLLILEKLSYVLIKARKATQARKYARKMVELNKRDAKSMHVLAKVYDAMGEPKSALFWINSALKQDPDNEKILASKAEYHSTAGQMEQSIETHRRILEINPLSGHSWWPIAQLQNHSGENAKVLIETIETAISATSDKDTLRGLGFAAGKINQDIGNYDKAFIHFTNANLLHGKEISADRIIAANINIRETYSKKILELAKEQTDHSYRPIFVMGQTRSGTTLTESLCASHTRISAGGELANISDLNNKLELFSTLENKHRSNIHNLGREEIRRMAGEYISDTKHLIASNTRLTDKLPHNFLNIGLIALLFPNSQIIHCRRHPLDNCLSIFSNPMLDYHKEYKSTLETLGEYYRNYQQIMEFWKEICPVPILDVYYEDLVTNTEAVARRMINYLGLEWEDRVMERRDSQKSVKTLSVWQVRQPVFQTSKGKWRNYEEQLQPLRKILESEIKAYEHELAELDAS